MVIESFEKGASLQLGLEGEEEGGEEGGVGGEGGGVEFEGELVV